MRALILFVLAAIPVLETTACRGQESLRKTAPFRAAELPRPPMQSQAWQPPATAIPAFILQAATALHSQGFADPRMCEYREVELAGEARLDKDPASPRPVTHAWVLPAAPGEGARFAVAWNGLVYPLSGLGAGADLDADIQTLVARARESQRPVYPWDFAFSSAVGNLQTAGQNSLTPAKVCLLLLLGRTALAETLWAAGTGEKLGTVKGDPTGWGVSYLTLAGDWAWALLDRAAVAHEHGDDALARATLRELARLQPILEARAEAMHFERPFHPDPNAGPQPYFGFLAPVKKLLADQERRAREPLRTPAVLVAKDISEPQERIGLLIRDFDQIASYLPWVHGPTAVAGQAALTAVIKEADAAVPALLECLQSDERLTRVVGRLAPNHRVIRVQGVDKQAFRALTTILGTHEFGPVSRYFAEADYDLTKRAAVAEEIRDYWTKTRGMSEAERHFRILASDATTPEQWLDAAEGLVQPANMEGRGRAYSVYPVPPNPEAPSRGEPLRGRRNPSVAELMARRCAAIDPPDALIEQGSAPIPQSLSANQMALFLASWDITAALPTLKARVLRSIAVDRAQQPKSRLHVPAISIAQLTLVRAKGHDPSAFDDYVGWVRKLTPGEYSFFPNQVFEPLWREPENPRCREAVAALFDTPGSPWLPLYEVGEKPLVDPSIRAKLIVSPLLGFAAFRKRVRESLADDRPAGSVECDAHGNVQVKRESMTTFPQLRADDPLRPRPGSTMTLRVRDLVASHLAELAELPRFELHWPEPRRDAVIASMNSFLNRYGERLKSPDGVSALFNEPSFFPQEVRAILSFGALDHPATDEDVRAGRAIFALDALKPARTVPLPRRPMVARWTTLEIPRDDPALASQDPKNTNTAQYRYLQYGYVWQAEEQRDGDRWRRFYGFAGAHAVARVPAEEIDFPAEDYWKSGWVPFSRDLDARLVPPGAKDEGRGVFPGTVKRSSPMLLTVAFRNHRGIDVPAPQDLVRPGYPPSLRQGFSIHLFREPETRPGQPTGTQQGGDTAQVPWSEIRPEPAPVHHESRSEQTLEPTRSRPALRLDLAEFFVISKPGNYRLELRSEALRDEDGKPGIVAGTFQVVP